MKHGFLKVATATPRVTVADCDANVHEMLQIFSKAADAKVQLLLFPELSLTGASCADLFFSETLLASAEAALTQWLRHTKDSSIISILGFPFVVNDKIYNCAAICQKGHLLGIVPKTSIPTFANPTQARVFSSYEGETLTVSLCGEQIPFGNGLLFVCNNLPNLRLGVELGEDLASMIPPSSLLCAAGATVIAHPAASMEIVGKENYRRLLARSQSARSICAYLSADCGEGESTTDGVYGGHCMIVESGTLLAERRPFAVNDLLVTEIDLSRILNERKHAKTSNDYVTDITTIPFSLELAETELTRPVARFPFIPEDPTERALRCETILTIQAKGLAQRIVRSYSKSCVIGISGGLDSCLALLVAVKAMDLLDMPHDKVVCVTMPGFGTTTRTKSNAERLCEELGTTLRCISIADSVRQHFADIGHDESDHSVVYENAQARERTQILMDLANTENGLVVGTGDLSELALGWATYNGDHMSMYGVNADVPKTLIRHVVAFCADSAEAEGKQILADVLRDILDTPVSPELLPADDKGNIAQKTEDLVGPYELHDFYLYHMIRFHCPPDKLYRLAKVAFAGVYSDEVLLKWLKNFVRRFFAQQFKRSCLPDGPKVGTVGFSPRGDWSMPSDASARAWMKIAESL